MRPSDDDLHPGHILGPYELIVPVGSGGMAHVWAARRRDTNVVHALKMLMPHLTENVSFREMFFDEARIASRIQHENVCKTFGLVDLEGLLALVMEWVDGSSLVRVLRPGPPNERNPRVALPTRVAVKIVADACAGLHAAHELVDGDGRPLSVVHRDVSPHNILLTLDGRVKVTDFGVAKALGKLHMTVAGQVKGKLAYMSPEQLAGGEVDRRSDVFALGNVLYETTTGQRPFQGDHDPQLMASILTGRVEPPSSLVRDYPRALEAILMRALATDPDARYPTALELWRALERWLQSSGPPVQPPQIAALLRARCSQDIEARAADLMPVGAPDPRTAAPRESGSATMEVAMQSSPPKDEPPGLSILAGVLAMLVGVVLGLGVLFYVHAARTERALASAARSAAGHASARVVGSTDAGPPKVDAEEKDEGGLDAPRSTHVRLEVPDGAHLFIDEVELPPGTRVIPRPATGTIQVLVRAESHQDTIVVVDSTSPETLAVTMLRKKPRPAAPPAPPVVTPPPNPYE